MKLNKQNLQQYINHNQNRSTLGVALSMSTGIRIGELCALQWKDVDLEKSYSDRQENYAKNSIPYRNIENQAHHY